MTAFGQNSLDEIDSYDKTAELVLPLSGCPAGELWPECWLSAESLQAGCTGGALEVTVQVRAQGAVLCRESIPCVSAVETGAPLAPADPDISLRSTMPGRAKRCSTSRGGSTSRRGRCWRPTAWRPAPRPWRKPAACWCPAPPQLRGGTDTVENPVLYREIGRRTGGDIYIGVVGPVRSGKSTFIKQFMEALVLPALEDPAALARAKDELPQSAAGRTIMTTEPKFIPEAAVPLQLEGGGECRVRLIDCVGYMVEGAMGHEEDDKPRMVKSPWFDEAVPFDLAAETGTRKVIRDHSTIGVVVTTDGSISDIPRAGYEQAEGRVIAELEALGKPYVILLNSTHPDDPETVRLAARMEQQYGRAVLPVSCVDLDAPPSKRSWRACCTSSRSGNWTLPCPAG